MTTPADKLDQPFSARLAAVELGELEQQLAQLDEDGHGGEGAAWPALGPAALHGLAGTVVRTYDPHTEADPAAVLFVLLAYVGCYIGPDAHVIGGNVRHPAKVWPVLVGKSSSGAKGTAVAVVESVMDRVDLNWRKGNRAAGLSTSEGLIRRVRDGQGDNPDAKDFDEGVTDKRLVVYESEFVNVLIRGRREGNTLSGTIRDAYDGQPLQTLTSGNPLMSTGHHVTIVGGITPLELVDKLTAIDLANGFANRFMPVCSRRSKKLPEGSEPAERELAWLGEQIRNARNLAGTLRGGLTRTPAARELWIAEYRRWGALVDGMPEGPVSDLMGRWNANMARLSLIYALLDGGAAIDVEHVQAASAAWQYVYDSARHIFGSESADPNLGRLVEYIDSNPDGIVRTRSEIWDLFGRRMPKAQLDALLAKLLATGRYACTKVPSASGRGRPALVYHRTLTVTAPAARRPAE